MMIRSALLLAALLLAGPALGAEPVLKGLVPDGPVPVWRDEAAREVGVIAVLEWSPAGPHPYVSCLAKDGARVSVTARGSGAVGVEVLDGPSVGCRGIVSAGQVARAE